VAIERKITKDEEQEGRSYKKKENLLRKSNGIARMQHAEWKRGRHLPGVGLGGGGGGFFRNCGE